MEHGNSSEWDQSIYNPANKGKNYIVPEKQDFHYGEKSKEHLNSVIANAPKELFPNHGNIMGWKSKTLDFGIVKEKSLNYGLFSYNGDKRIQQVRTSCNCIAQITVDDGRLISFQWKADEIPPHLNEMNVTKLLFVTFADHTEDACEVRAKIIR